MDAPAGDLGGDGAFLPGRPAAAASASQARDAGADTGRFRSGWLFAVGAGLLSLLTTAWLARRRARPLV